MLCLLKSPHGNNFSFSQDSLFVVSTTFLNIHEIRDWGLIIFYFLKGLILRHGWVQGLKYGHQSALFLCLCLCVSSSLIST